MIDEELEEHTSAVVELINKLKGLLAVTDYNAFNELWRSLNGDLLKLRAENCKLKEKICAKQCCNSSMCSYSLKISRK
jgi:hypothetical protein